jgi:hypothetical protein
LNSEELRAWARQCAERAGDDNCPADERARYLVMQESLLALAVNADWLAGRRSQAGNALPIRPDPDAMHS